MIIFLISIINFNINYDEVKVLFTYAEAEDSNRD